MARGSKKVNDIGSKTNKKECVRCKKIQPLTNFYVADQLLYSDSRFCICKICIENIIQQHGFKGFIIVLRAMNRPFLQDIWTEDYKDYIRQISSLPQYKGMTFDDSIFDNTQQNKTKDEEIDESHEYNITPAMRRFWRGYKDHEIMILEDYFQELIASYECETPVQRSIYRNMAITQYMADNATTASEFDKLMGTLSKLMNDANVKPVQESGANDQGLSTWGEWIRKIEETEPIPEPSEEFKDVDRIRKYINQWFIKHFAKIFGISNDKNEEDDIITELKGDV